MRTIAITGSKYLPESYRELVEKACLTADMVLVGSAQGTDEYARNSGARCKIFHEKNYESLAKTSQTMLLTLYTQSSLKERCVVGFPINESPISMPLPLWIDARSNTWSTLALAAGVGLEVHVFKYGEMWLPVWPGFIWENSTRFNGAWYLVPTKRKKNVDS